MKNLIKVNHELIVKSFLETTNDILKLKLLAGENGLNERKIADRAVNRPALALTGYFKHFAQKRIQYVGFCELSYILDLEKNDQINALSKINDLEVPCFIFTNRIATPQHIIDFFDTKSLPLFSTELSSVDFIEYATIFLDEYFSPSTVIFGTLIEINGIGVLIQGSNAIQKSVTTIALIKQGHTLIADEVVCISCRHNGKLVGKSKDISHGFMEFHGIGLLKLTEHFGQNAVKDMCDIDLVIRFNEDTSLNNEKTGLEKQMTCSILDHELPLVFLPHCSGNDSYYLIEIATMLHFLKNNGNNPAEELTQRLIKHMRSQNS